jgi:hypothetical protein
LISASPVSHSKITAVILARIIALPDCRGRPPSPGARAFARTAGPRGHGPPAPAPLGPSAGPSAAGSSASFGDLRLRGARGVKGSEQTCRSDSTGVLMSSESESTAPVAYCAGKLGWRNRGQLPGRGPRRSAGQRLGSA